MRRKSVLALLRNVHRNELAGVASRLITQHGLHGSRWLLRDIVEPDPGNDAQLDLIAPADLSWLDTCEVTAQLLIRAVEAASIPDLANASAILSERLAPELRTAWLNAAKQLDLARRPLSESVEQISELAAQVSAARDAIAFHLADRADAAALWERVVTDWASLIIAHHRPLVWATAERPADLALVAELLPLSVAIADLSANPGPLQELATLLPAPHLAAASDLFLNAAGEPTWHPRWTTPLLHLAERAADAAGRRQDLERILLPMLPKSRDALVFYIEQLARRSETDEAHYWLSEGQRLFPRDAVWDRLLEKVGR